MGQAPLDGLLHRTENIVPGGSERLSRLTPGEPFSPSRQKPLIGVRHVILAVGPGNGFDGHLATRTIHPPHRVDQEDSDPPKRNEVKLAFREMIITWPDLAASRATGTTVLARLDFHQKTEARARLVEVDLGVDKALVRFNAVEDSLEKHPVRSPVRSWVTTTSLIEGRAGCISKTPKWLFSKPCLRFLAVVECQMEDFPRHGSGVR